MKLIEQTPLLSSLFNPQKIPDDAKRILKNFDAIIQNNLQLNSRQLLKLPCDIQKLSHQLTDERDTRRMSYMNDKTLLSAYVRYFMWWNLERLSRLFSNVDMSQTDLQDGDICLDIGSGPLTVVSALWLSCPHLRKKKLTWYCLDLSQSALSLGENIYLSIAAKTTEATADTDDAPTHWEIIRVKGPLGTHIKQKAKLITCANVFNEVFQSESHPLDFLAKQYYGEIAKYADEKTSFFIVEPGVPRSARFISLMRDVFIRKKMNIVAPCSHCGECPMDGRFSKNAHSSKDADSHRTGKWCNFSFPTKNAPEKLQKLSAAAKLPKDRAVLSFVFSVPAQKESNAEEKNDARLSIRIASDPIRLGEKTGFYACSKLGLILYIPKKSQPVFSGDLLSVKVPDGKLPVDFKTEALIIEESSESRATAAGEMHGKHRNSFTRTK